MMGMWLCPLIQLSKGRVIFLSHSKSPGRRSGQIAGTCEKQQLCAKQGDLMIVRGGSGLHVAGPLFLWPADEDLWVLRWETRVLANRVSDAGCFPMSKAVSPLLSETQRPYFSHKQGDGVPKGPVPGTRAEWSPGGLPSALFCWSRPAPWLPVICWGLQCHLF